MAQEMTAADDDEASSINEALAFSKVYNRFDGAEDDLLDADEVFPEVELEETSVPDASVAFTFTVDFYNGSTDLGPEPNIETETGTIVKTGPGEWEFTEE